VPSVYSLAPSLYPDGGVWNNAMPSAANEVKLHCGLAIIQYFSGKIKRDR
jgi:hypothetical protein